MIPIIHQSIHQQFCQYIDASLPMIYLRTFEEMKAELLIRDAALNTERKVYEWTSSSGLQEWDVTLNPMVKIQMFEVSNSLHDTLSLLKLDDELEGRILVIKDIHLYIDHPRIVSMLKEITNRILYGGLQSMLIFISTAPIPKELENYITLLEFGHLEEEDIKQIIENFAAEHPYLPAIPSGIVQQVITAFKGLTEYDIRNILALGYADGGSFNPSDLKLVQEQKKQIILKSGTLEMVSTWEEMSDIGGLENLKNWLRNKGAVMKNLDQALAYGVDTPKGVLIAGVSGCGKSLSAKAAAKLFNVPLIRLDMGRLLGKYVGESEENMRRATELADAISPCVLWIDELEKAFAGIGEGSNGAEVTTRLFGHFLTWMQEKTSAAFVVATANDVMKLPPELLRKGRFDEVFYVGLPDLVERQQIFEIHIGRRRKQDLKNIDLAELAAKTEGFSGADIEGVVKDSIERAFALRHTELTTWDLLETILVTHSLSEIMKEPLEAMTREYERRKFKKASIG